MNDLSDLYQEVILDHGKQPRNFREIESADRQAQGFNPLCGDRVTVFVKMRDDTLEDIAFTGAGCAICTASASLMTQHLKGCPNAEVRATFDAFHDLLTARDDRDPDPGLGKLAALTGVRKYPIRVKCATLPWHTMMAALNQSDEGVTTE